MCTAVLYSAKNHYFGRNLDYERDFGEEIFWASKEFPFTYKMSKSPEKQFAVMGIALVSDGYPLFFDGINEKGLGMAGLHFVGNAFYEEPEETAAEDGFLSCHMAGKKNQITPYELIPWVLTTCKNVKEARETLMKTKLVAIPFSDRYPLSPLHFMLADKKGDCIVVEPVKEGLKIYDNPYGVLTNNPPFPFQTANLNNYLGLMPGQPTNTFCRDYSLKTYSRGMGGLGLPGDYSSMSRFVRAAFVRGNSYIETKKGESEESIEEKSVSQFFHILSGVEQPRGCVEVEKGAYEYTRYSCCYNLEKGILYEKRYDSMKVRKEDMKRLQINAEK